MINSSFGCNSFANESEIAFDSDVVMQTGEIQSISIVGQVAEMHESVGAEPVTEEQTTQNEMNQAEEQILYSEEELPYEIEREFMEEISDEEVEALENEATPPKRPYIPEFGLLVTQDELNNEFVRRNFAKSCDTEIRIGIVFADIHRRFVRYNVTEKIWYCYDRKKWVPDEGALIVMRYVKQFIFCLTNYAATLNDKWQYYRFVRKYDNQAIRERLIKDVRERHCFKSEDLNADIYLFNCQNGTYDFKTFTFREHRPEDMISKISNVYYDEIAESKDFEKFFNDIMMGDTEKIELLQKLFGYSLTGDTSLEKFVIIWGESTRNGKSTLLESIAYLMGNADGYALSTEPEVFAEMKRDSRQASGEIARLDGCRFLESSEPKKNMRLDSALLKKLTGRDKVVCRKLYQSEREFVPRFKLFFNTNHRPKISDDTVFASKRVILIPFERHFTEAEQDIHLKDRLTSKENISGLFNWLVEGYKKFLSDKELKLPDSIEKAIENYRQWNDVVVQFADEELEVQDGNILYGENVYQRYVEWSELNGFFVMKKHAFYEALKKRKIMLDTCTVNGKTKRNIVKGYRFIIDENEPESTTEQTGKKE